MAAIRITRGGRSGGGSIRWTRALREAFLDHLAMTCCVSRSARAIGVEPWAVYALRRIDTGFADAWGVALMQGYQALELRLLGQALRGPGADAEPDVDMLAALRLLTLHRNAPGKPVRRRPQPDFALSVETDAVLLKKLAEIEARRAAMAEAAHAAAANGAAAGQGEA